MKTGWRVLVSWLAIAVWLTVGLAPASATTFTVDSANYSKSDSVASSAFDTFELTAQSGQHVKYTMTVTSSGGCAMLLFVKGHNVNPSSQYYVAYSQENCVSSYSNDFPVASSDGTTFSVVVLTQQSQNVDYSVTIQTYSPAIPDWVLGVVVFLGIVVVIAVIRTVIRRRRAKAMPPPMQPPMQPPMGGQTPPPP